MKENINQEFINYIKSVEEEIIKMEKTKTDLKQTIKSIEYLKKGQKGEKIVNLGFFYIKTQEEINKLLIPIGDKYLINMKIEDALIYFSEKLEEIERQIHSLKHYYEHLIKEMEEKIVKKT